MTIRDYIRHKVFAPRVEENGILVIYDPVRRFREIALGMERDYCRVIDVGESVITQRERAMESLLDLAEGKIHHLVIWVPVAPPEEESDFQKDPFTVFAKAGAVYPRLEDGESFASLCRKAKADHIPEINRLFESSEPSFEMVDALDEGGSWPKLKTLLGAGSVREILLGVLAPRPAQEAALKTDGTWVGEMRDFLQRSLGLKLRTKGQLRASIAEEVWQVVLFSEFHFDSAGAVPPALETVVRAGDEARELIFDLCDELRKHEDHRQAYLEAAQAIEDHLQLAVRAAGMTHLGVRDTFSFEERLYLQRMVDRALAGDLDGAMEIHSSRRKSIWLAQEERLAEWTLASRALELMMTAGRLNAPKFPSLEAIIHGYALHWRSLDRHHREMEQARNAWEGEHEGLEALVAAARKAYFHSVEALQAEFIRLVAAEGWPASGGQILSNTRVFSTLVAPALDRGEKVAYFLVDSLRYELGAELEKQLADKMQVTLHTVCAQLPTYTEVGMASLMPEAETALKLVERDGRLVTTLGGNPATVPATRFAWLQSRKGDLAGDILLDDLIRQKKPKITDRVRLLVVRTHEIDALAHANPHHVLQIIPTLIRQILRGLARAADLGFTHAVIATDHGFVLVHEQSAGNLVPRPAGTWLTEKSRCLLGHGQADAANIVLNRADVGIPGDFAHYAAPRALVPYSRGQMYYHEGLSLQECVLPCLSVRLESQQRKSSALPEIRLSLTYKQGKTDRITSMRPVLDLAWPEGELFTEDREIEVVVEAVDAKKKVVGTVGSGQFINAATGGVRIKPGMALSVSLRMEEEFSGNFTVRVLESSSNSLLADLNLRTAYLNDA